VKGEDNEPSPRGRDRFRVLHVGIPDVARVSYRLKY